MTAQSPFGPAWIEPQNSRSLLDLLAFRSSCEKIWGHSSTSRRRRWTCKSSDAARRRPNSFCNWGCVSAAPAPTMLLSRKLRELAAAEQDAADAVVFEVGLLGGG